MESTPIFISRKRKTLHCGVYFHNGEYILQVLYIAKFDSICIFYQEEPGTLSTWAKEKRSGNPPHFLCLNRPRRWTPPGKLSGNAGDCIAKLFTVHIHSEWLKLSNILMSEIPENSKRTNRTCTSHTTERCESCSWIAKHRKKLLQHLFF